MDFLHIIFITTTVICCTTTIFVILFLNNKKNQNNDEISNLQLDKIIIEKELTKKETELLNAKETIKSIKDLHEKEKNEWRETQERTIREIKEEYKISLENLKQDHNKAQEAIENRFNRTLTELKVAQENEIKSQDKRLKTEFENAANLILKSHTEEFSNNSQKKLNDIINPLNEHIEGLKKQVKDAYDTELREKASLSEQLKQLTVLNERMSNEANNLTKALKGDIKTQGCWGEQILENILEASGLVKDRDYEREKVINGIENDIIRPDVVVHLPDNKHIIIDSKVTLVAYERMVTCDDRDLFATYQKEHLQSVKKHIDNLASKQYQNSNSLNSPDFVLLFMPIEGAFSAAIQGDNDIYNYAWNKKIVIVSPTTLLATLRTIASIWQQENQQQNAKEIARLGGVIYNKLAAMVKDFEDINTNIERTQKSYNNAMNKMKDGTGNIFITAEKIKKLGAKTDKNLPSELTASLQEN